ncbi:hypothetical protein [Microvirga sesbaniae]|uniref:hypothetical protein n=1 Tax=Microvirga sesbaniae TaxID=681392 RepID=UPI0021C567EF|nr:hypothetical protein [Microvirga sp. HBU67692]
MLVAPEILKDVSVKANLAHCNPAREWIDKVQNASRSEERYDRAQATEYIKRKVRFDWPSDMLEILARSGRGPHYEEDYMSGDLWYRLRDIDGWLQYYFPDFLPADEPRFRIAEFRSLSPVRWLYATDVRYFPTTLSEHLEWWCCDVVEVSTALGAAMCAGSDVDSAILELNSNFDATIVVCEILKQRKIPAIVIVRGVNDVPSAISDSAYVLREACCMEQIERAIIQHIGWPVMSRMRMSGVLDN